MKRSLGPFLRYPLTRVAALVVILWVFWALRYFAPGAGMAVGIGMLGFSVFAGWFGLFLRSEAARELSRQPVLIGNLEDERSLEADFRQLNFDRGIDQLHLLRGAFNALAGLIEIRLNAGEITFDRYMKAAEAVYRASVQNLREALIALQSVSAIDPRYVAGRPKEADTGAPGSARDPAETAVTARIALRDRQLQRVDGLLALNEASLTALGTTASALADTQTGARGAIVDARAAIDHLESLARRTSQYAASSVAEGNPNDHD